MVYPSSHPVLHEKLLYECQMHWVSLIPGIISALFAVGCIVFGIWSSSNYFYFGLIYLPILEPCLFLSLLFLVLTIRSVIIYNTTQLYFTSIRLVHRVGILRKQTHQTPLNKIDHISLSQRFFGRMLDYGDIEVHSTSGKITYHDILSPNDFANALMQQISIGEQISVSGFALRGTASAPAPAPLQTAFQVPRRARASYTVPGPPQASCPIPGPAQTVFQVPRPALASCPVPGSPQASCPVSGPAQTVFQVPAPPQASPASRSSPGRPPGYRSGPGRLPGSGSGSSQ
jgi:hypothetical protein